MWPVIELWAGKLEPPQSCLSHCWNCGKKVTGPTHLYYKISLDVLATLLDRSRDVTCTLHGIGIYLTVGTRLVCIFILWTNFIVQRFYSQEQAFLYSLQVLDLIPTELNRSRHTPTS